MPKERRQKAKDVFKESKPFLGTTSFEKAFPMVDELKVQVTEEGEGVEGGSSTSSYGKTSAGEYINCSNPLCYKGGFDLGGILRTMTYDREARWSGSKSCQGYEGSPKGRKNYGPCYNRFEIAIELTYKGADS